MSKKKDTYPKGYDQRVSVEDNWLTKWNGTFVKVIHLPIGEVWEEVTDEYYQEWKEKYQPEPTEEAEE